MFKKTCLQGKKSGSRLEDNFSRRCDHNILNLKITKLSQLRKKILHKQGKKIVVTKATNYKQTTHWQIFLILNILGLEKQILTRFENSPLAVH